MRIAILSRNSALYSTHRLVKVAQSRGHKTRILDTLSIAVEVGISRHEPAGMRMIGTSPLGFTRTVGVPEVDAIIPRIGASVTFYGLAVVRQFEALGVITTATADAIACSRDKLHSLQTMDQANLPIPRSAVIASPKSLIAAVQVVGGLPVVIKLIRGTQGKGVVLARNLATAGAVLDKVHAARRQALVQEFISEAGGRDQRLIIVGNRCVAAMERVAAEGEFRANLHRGGSAVPIEPDSQTERLAVAAAKAHGLAVAGVDLLQSNQGPLLLEVNSSPGLEGIENATGKDVAGAIIDYLEKEARRNGIK
ncbi:MAG: RimK family alpha-L-glutamate ligase [Candidatus Promineifilaceae bacterium]